MPTGCWRRSTRRWARCRLDRIAAEAARHWGLEDARIVLAARRENVVYRVTAGDADYALRLHRPGYRNAAQLRSELQWMAVLAEGGLDVPAPLATCAGGFLAEVGGHLVDVLSWVPGAALGKAGQLEGVADRAGFCHALGAAMARMHDIGDAWVRPEGFPRPSWDRDGLLGEAPLWGRFWDHPHLGTEDRELLLEVRAQADAELARQYAMARELRGEPQGEWVPAQTALMDQPAYWTPERIHLLRTWLTGPGQRAAISAAFVSRETSLTSECTSLSTIPAMDSPRCRATSTVSNV